MLFHDLMPWIVFAVTLIASILTGITSGGGGYIVTPFMIAIGLTPQQSIATVKLWALGIDGGSIAAYRGRPVKHKSIQLFLIISGAVVGIISAIAIRRIGNDNLQVIMGSLNLIMVPLLFIKHHKIKSRARNFLVQALGWSAIIILMLLQGIFASGVGILINVLLIAVFGISVLETTLIKRRFSFVSDFIVLGGLLGSGLINFKYGIIMAAAGWIGTD
jgi:uncharacterized membrane protein YfcA